MKLLSAILLAFILFASVCFSQSMPKIEPGVSQDLAKWRSLRYSNVRYKLDLTIEKQAPQLKGRMEIGLTVGARNKDEVSATIEYPIILDWRKIKGLERYSTFSNLTLNGRAADVIEENEHLIISGGVITGENVVALDFTSPIAASGSAVTRYTDKEDGGEYIYSLFVPSDASTAFPIIDQPDLKARFTLNVNAPADWKVISNTSGKTAGTLTTFPETKPISTYVFAFALGNFETFTDKTPAATSKSPSTNIYVRRSQAKKFVPHSSEVFRLNREATEFLASWFDFDFPFPKYDLVLIPEFPFGGMEHAGATFLRENAIIFPSEPTKNDYVSRANLMSHEAAHQWFGDTVTMKWFDDLWLKEGFAEFMAFKTLEKLMPQYQAWKIFYERNKQAAYRTDITKGTTPIYQIIPNLSAAKSAYGNIVYRKAPSFLKQSEFFLGNADFQKAVRALLKSHAYGNAEWKDLVNEFEQVSKSELNPWAEDWVTKRGAPIVRLKGDSLTQENAVGEKAPTGERIEVYTFKKNPNPKLKSTVKIENVLLLNTINPFKYDKDASFIFPNFNDYGYGIFLLDQKNRTYALNNIQSERDDFLRTMIWGALWDSVKFSELDPVEYVNLVVKNIKLEQDESTISLLMGRTSDAMTNLIPDDSPQHKRLSAELEFALLDRITNAETKGQRITYYRSFVANASSKNARLQLKNILSGKSKLAPFELRSRDKFDIATRLLVLGDPEAEKLLGELELQYPDDDSKRYAYSARAGIGTAENKAKYWRDFINEKAVSESWVESAVGVFNNSRQSKLTLPYLERALNELPNLKRTRKIFFVNNWLSSFIGGQNSAEALAIVQRFLEANPTLDRDLILKVRENSDALERAVKIRAK